MPPACSRAHRVREVLVEATPAPGGTLTVSHPDLVWRNRTTGGNNVWFMDGLTVTGDWAFQPVPDTTWWILRHRW